MSFPTPDRLFDWLAPRLPEIPAREWQTIGGGGLLAASVCIAFHYPWLGAGLLLVGAIAAGAGEALARREGMPVVPVLPLGLLTVLFGFGLAEPTRALAAMFLMFAVTVLLLLGGAGVSAVIWLTVGAFLLACLLPSSFSLLAYVIGVIAFIAAGQGIAKGRL
jgi:hypothetical protein